MENQLRFDDRVAIVTGGARGLGLASAMLLAQRGATVVVSDNGTGPAGEHPSDRPAAEAADAIRRAGGTAWAHAGGIDDVDVAADVVRQTVDRFGRLDIVVSAAGIIAHSTFPETSPDVFDRHMRVDPGGSFNMLRAAWPHLVQSDDSRVVLMSTSGAFGVPTLVPYSTGKSAVVGLGRSLAMAGAEHGILINTLLPYGFSRMSTAAPNLSQAELDARAKLAAPERVAALVAFLAHPACAVSGQLYVVGAGRVARVVSVEVGGHFDPELTPEHVRDHWNSIHAAPADYLIENGLSYNRYFYDQVPGWNDAMEASKRLTD